MFWKWNFLFFSLGKLIYPNPEVGKFIITTVLGESIGNMFSFYLSFLTQPHNDT